MLVAVDLQELLTNQGIPGHLAQRLVAQKDPEAVAKVLLNAFYLQSQGKLQNGPGYIRAGIEDGYDLLPQVASRLENRRRELEAQLRSIAARQQQTRELDQHAIDPMLALDPERLYRTVEAEGLSMCGVIPATVALSYARERKATSAELVAYATSGDAFGDRARVVGYAGIVID